MNSIQPGLRQSLKLNFKEMNQKKALVGQMLLKYAGTLDNEEAIFMLVVIKSTKHNKKIETSL